MMRLKLVGRISTVVLVFAATVPSAELATRKALTLDVAKQIAAASERFARQKQWNVAMSIVDEGGHLIYFQRMDGVQTGSIEVSMRKAKSAAAFKRPGKVFSDAVAKGRVALLGLPGAMPFEGGVPITVDGQVIGAVGVSGVTGQQDGMIAQAGVDALPSILRR